MPRKGTRVVVRRAAKGRAADCERLEGKVRINAITPDVALVVANSLPGFPPPLRDVTAWQETAGDQMIVHFEVYDPVREVTQHGQSAPIFGVSNLQAHDGVVSWKAHYGGATSDQAKFVLFDPVRGSW